MQVKALRTDEWEFVKAVRRYPKLVELVDQPPSLGPYIEYDSAWRVYRVGYDGLRKYRGRFSSLIGAVFNARLVQ